METTMTRSGIAGAIRDYGAYRRMVRELAWLSDRELSDIGVSRSDIRPMTKTSVYGR